MKMKSRIAFIAVICLLIGYLVWVLVPFDETVAIYDEVGLTGPQQESLVDFARSINSFPESTVSKLKRESFFTPWSRGKLFISISGTQAEVKVKAGFHGGPLYGGGRIFTAKWVDGTWQFTNYTGRGWVS